MTGRGAVTIFDRPRMVSNAYEAKRSSPLLASGVVLHMLPAGAAFDLTTRTLVPHEPRRSTPEDAAEIAEAGRDLRQLARDIAAERRVRRTALRRRLATAPPQRCTSERPTSAARLSARTETRA